MGRYGERWMLEEKADTSKWEGENRFSLFGRALGFIDGGRVRLVGCWECGSLEK